MIMKNCLKLIILISLLLACNESSEKSVNTQSSASVTHSLDKIISEYVDDKYYKGNILVAKGDSIIYTSSSSLANIEKNIQNAKASIFEIASISKSFTATMIMQLIEEGKLSLDDSLTKFESLNLKSEYHPITLVQLLNHTSGIIDHDEVDGFFSKIAVKNQNREEIVALINEASLLFKPGTDFRYSNFGYNLLAYLIEDVTKKTFNQNLSERIFNPLKLNSTYRVNGLPDFNKESIPYTYNIFQESNIANPYSHSVDIGAGGIYSNIYDMLKWSKSFNENQLISQKSKELMFKPNEYGWGFGWEKRTLEIDSSTSIDYMSHGALANGYWGLLTKVEDYTVVLLSNHRPNDIILNNIRPIPIRFINENIIRVLFHQDTLPYEKSLARKFSAEILKKDLNEVIPMLNENLDDFSYKESEFMVLGYELLELGQKDKGIGIFNYMMSRTKDFGLVYECLGDAHFYYTKDLEKAKAFYNKALEYNPSNSYLTSQIKNINNEIRTN